jgi:hypothetical protein
MAWITVDQHLAKHRKTLELARLLHKDPRWVVGVLLEIWGWAIDHARDGQVDPEEDAPSLAGSLRTSPSTATRLLLGAKSVGFIDADWRFHEWERWAGKAVVDREKDALRKRLFREHRRGEHSLYIEGCPTCVRGTSSGQPSSRNGLRPVDIQRTQGVGQEGASSGPSGGRPGVEKRREDTPYPQTDADAGWIERRAAELVESTTGRWHDVVAQLRDRAVGEGAMRSFVTHFAEAQLEERGNGYAITVTKQLHADWITRRYRDQIIEGLGTDELVIEVRS